MLDLLDARRDCKLTVIHAPAGFGKTTLAIQWRERLQRRGAAVAWSGMSRDKSDLGRFLICLVEAMRAAEPSITLDVAALLEAKAEQAAGSVLTELINALDACKRDLYLILDDWHLVEREQVQDVITFLLDLAQPALHIVLVSREPPKLPLARLRVSGQLSELTQSDLRFSLVESEEFLCAVSELRLDENLVQSLWHSTEGWIAALQLASLSLRTAAEPELLVESFSGKHRSIGEYLAENVLDQLPADALEFLLTTSILDRLRGDLCAAVSGIENSQQMLETLRKQGLFIHPLDEIGEWFRYHHLFASYLQHRLQRRTPQAVADLHRAASRWYSENGFVEQAVSHALAAGELDQAVDLVECNAMWLVEHSYMATLRNLVRKLPPDRLEGRPKLQLATAWGYCLTHSPDEARAVLERAEAMLAKQALSPLDESVTEARLVEACIRIYEDKIEGIEESVRPVVERVSSYGPWVTAAAANILSYVYFQRSEYEEILRLQAWARPFQDRSRGPFVGIYGRCFAGLAAQELGLLNEGIEHFRGALRAANSSIGHHSHAARLAEALLGQALVECNHLDEAERLLEDSRKLGVEGGVADFSIATYISSSRLLARRGDLERANVVLEEGAQTARHLRLARLEAAVLCERMRLMVISGNVDAANRLADRHALGSCVDVSAPTSHTTELRGLALARLRRAQGRATEALTVLEPLLKAAIAQRRRLFEVTVRIQLALAFDAAGDQVASQAMLYQALQDGLEMGMKRSFLDEGPRLLALTRKIHEQIARGRFGDAGWVSTRGALTDLVALGQRSDVAPAPSASARRSTGPGGERLKDREMEILRLLERGYSNKEVARRMSVSVDTVKWYLKAIYSKLNVSGRTQAVYEAKRSGALFPESGRNNSNVGGGGQ